MSEIARTPAPPYYAVIFTSQRADADPEYDRAADRMMTLAAAQPGFLGVDTARGGDGLGMTVSYWRSEAAIAAWKAEVEHRAAQRKGREAWYRAFRIRVARVEREDGMG